jgi:hypothetical protein
MNQSSIDYGRRLGAIAYARSGDKGSGANVAVLARHPAAYAFLLEWLTAERLAAFLEPLGSDGAVRYEVPNLEAFNFVFPRILAGGASRSLRLDTQGKALGQVVLELPLTEVDDAVWHRLVEDCP